MPEEVHLDIPFESVVTVIDGDGTNILTGPRRLKGVAKTKTKVLVKRKNKKAVQIIFMPVNGGNDSDINGHISLFAKRSAAKKWPIASVAVAAGRFSLVKINERPKKLPPSGPGKEPRVYKVSRAESGVRFARGGFRIVVKPK